MRKANQQGSNRSDGGGRVDVCTITHNTHSKSNTTTAPRIDTDCYERSPINGDKRQGDDT